MKIKFASIILVFSFIFAALPAPFAAAAAAGDETLRRETFLSQLITLPSGVTSGSPAVTRGQYAHALALLLGGSFSASEKLLESSFYDVTGYDVQTQAIIYLESRNVISGDTNKYFNPEANIKTEDAVKMIVTAMGYKPMADAAGGYPEGYMKTASNIGLLKGAGISAGSELTGTQLINMFYNSLDSYIASIDSVSGGSIEISSEGETLLSGILNMGHMRGTVNQTPYTSLYEADGCADGTVTVGETNFYFTDSSIIDYLGYNVDVYYTQDKGEKTIKAYEVSKRNEALVIDADLIEGFSNYELSYRPDGSDRTKTETLDKTIAVIYNGKFTDSFTEEMVNIDMGSITLISEGRSDYSVMIIEDYIDYVVASVDTQNEMIYTRPNIDNSQDGAETDAGQLIVDLAENDIDYKISDAKGIDMALGDIAGNSIMSIASSLDGRYIKIVISTETVSGNISSITTDKYDNPVWIVNDVEYRLSRNFKPNNPTINSGVKIFLDFKGKIAYYLMQSDSDGWLTGYIIKLYEDDVEGYRVKLLKSDNLVEDIDFANKINVNGISYSRPDLSKCSELIMDGRPKRQVIRYRTNGDGCITRVQTAVDEGSTMSQLRATTKKQRLYRSSTQSFDFETFLNSSTYIFIVPEENTPYIPGNDTNFKVVDSTYFADNQNITVQGYTVGDNMTEAYALVATRDVNTVPTTISDYLTPFVVSDISYEINEYDEQVTKMTVVQGAVENTYEVMEAALEQVINKGEGNFEVEVGDAIRFTRNSEGDINLIEMVYDASIQRYTKPVSSTINASYNCSYSFVYGRAEYRGSDNASRIFININDVNSDKIVRTGNRIIPIEKFGATVVDMSGKRPEVTTGDASELVKTADIFGNKSSSRIIYNTNFGTPTRIIIYNY